MRSGYSKIAFLGLIVAVGLVLHISLRFYLHSLFIGPIALSLGGAFLFPGSSLLLLTLLIACEILSTLRAGIMTGIILIPYIAHRMFRSIHVSFSIRFFMIILATTASQIVLLAALRLSAALASTPSLAHLPDSIPFWQIVGATVTTASISFLFTSLYRELFPIRTVDIDLTKWSTRAR